ncbi:hypothetical protein G7062_01880 [Erysipelothrix sp. HDW6C]|uniref:HdeD family acid-resistance protein n=1 Tax=Erysipelothrix sp. HDW6C TaxID=2714930 RepID=UPI00140C09E7|nr:DUF308 domain-containing protein [Erysipelothrix sp. HDW6C]QIK69106.1 hypothetical protein G7062_01880 [Erysipelothrix sp. HDW6C]
MKKSLRNLSIIEMITGVLLVVLGVYTMYNPNAIIGGVIVAFAILAIASGISDIAFYFEFESRTGAAPLISLLGAILSIIAGVLMLFNINLSLTVVTMLLPFWFIAHSISRIAASSIIRSVGGESSFWLSLIVSVLGIITGFMLLFNPVASLATTIILVSFYLMAGGISSFVNGISHLSTSRSL